jgi:chromosome condensin MukBEF complex kleisin-like MukF subunit
MTGPDQHLAIHAAHEIVQGRAEFHLEPRDVALLVLIRDDLQRRTTPTYVVSHEDLQSLLGTVDKLEAAPQGASERRLVESIARLTKSDCIVRADLSRLGNSRLAQYQLTPIGETIAEWRLKQSRLEGEPLSAILAAFIVQLTMIDAVATSEPTSDVWREQVGTPMQYVVRELLAAVQRHQRSLDRAHAEMRAFIPSLLKLSSEEAIDQCKMQIDSAMHTIRDLIQVTVSSANVAFGLVDSIQECAQSAGHDGAEELCDDVRRRLESIVDWTKDRHRDWGAHFESVHSFLRFVSMVDRTRKITDALKQSIGTVPNWTLKVANAAPLLTLKERPTAQERRTAPKRKRTDFVLQQENIRPDELPTLLKRLVYQHSTRDGAKWSEVVREAIADHGRSRVLFRLPSIMSQLIAGSVVDDTQRAYVHVDAEVQLEELSVRKR